ncbi:MAG: DNA repair protein RecO [Hyphomicrobiales bacterium]|nr:DNA repair protein RecO [Hyphomicrobiales bacterium]MDE2115279.1 DNA repair protein RecO [Hyphomicrobiales bacterium]
MDWQDEGLVIGVRRHGESSVILELMTALHGRHLGMVRGGRSKRMQPVLQPGNCVAANWRARIDEHLGVLNVEALRARAGAIMEREAALHGIALLGILLRLLPEREPYPELHALALAICDQLNEAGAGAASMARFELDLLTELGFGLDLEQCAVHGESGRLAYVSPRTGRAVCASAGLAYANRLLPLPAFLHGNGYETSNEISQSQLLAAFRMTGYFLHRHVFEPRGMMVPPVRENYVRLALASSQIETRD